MSTKIKLCIYATRSRPLLEEDFVSPNDSQIAHVIERLRQSDGKLEITALLESFSAIHQLTIFSEKNRFLVMGAEIAADGEHLVRSLPPVGVPKGFEYFFGEPFPASDTTTDPEIIALLIQDYCKFGKSKFLV